MSVEDVVKIKIHFEAAMDNTTGSGDHWILMSLLGQHGFKTNGTIEAMELAEEIIVQWDNTFRK